MTKEIPHYNDDGEVIPAEVLHAPFPQEGDNDSYGSTHDHEVSPTIPSLFDVLLAQLKLMWGGE